MLTFLTQSNEEFLDLCRECDEMREVVRQLEIRVLGDESIDSCKGSRRKLLHERIRVIKRGEATKFDLKRAKSGKIK